MTPPKWFIDKNKCNICCECINICSKEVIGMSSGKVQMLKFENCTYCEECVDICPENAIKFEWVIE